MTEKIHKPGQEPIYVPADPMHKSGRALVHSSGKWIEDNCAGLLEMDWQSMKVIHITES